MVIKDVDLQVETRRQRGQLVASEVLVMSVRLKAAAARRCSRCNTRCPGYDGGGDEPRRWRTLDVGTTKCYLQAWAPRVECAEHGVVVSDVPWARPGTKPRGGRFTQAWSTARARSAA